MKIGGHGLREHIRFLSPLFAFIGAVWLLRLMLAAAGVSPKIVYASSVMGAVTLSVFLAVLLIHIRHYGGYVNVVAASFLLTAWAQFLIVLAVIFAVISRTNNIFTAPAYETPGDDAYHLRHIIVHLTIGIGAETLFGAAMGCFLLWMFRMLIPERPQPR